MYFKATQHRRDMNMLCGYWKWINVLPLFSYNIVHQIVLIFNSKYCICKQGRVCDEILEDPAYSYIPNGYVILEGHPKSINPQPLSHAHYLSLCFMFRPALFRQWSNDYTETPIYNIFNMYSFTVWSFITLGQRLHTYVSLTKYCLNTPISHIFSNLASTLHVRNIYHFNVWNLITVGKGFTLKCNKQSAVKTPPITSMCCSP